MGMKFEILAANYPFMGYQASCQCETMWEALKKFIEFKRKGYEIIDVRYRNIQERFTRSDAWREG